MWGSVKDLRWASAQQEKAHTACIKNTPCLIVLPDLSRVYLQRRRNSAVCCNPCRTRILLVSAKEIQAVAYLLGPLHTTEGFEDEKELSATYCNYNLRDGIEFFNWMPVATDFLVLAIHNPYTLLVDYLPKRLSLSKGSWYSFVNQISVKPC